MTLTVLGIETSCDETSVAIIELTLLFESVKVAPFEVKLTVNPPPKVDTGILSERLLSKTLAPATTCVFKVDVNVALGTSDKAFNCNSANKSTKASLIGAKTVNGAGAVPFGVDKVST